MNLSSDQALEQDGGAGPYGTSMGDLPLPVNKYQKKFKSQRKSKSKSTKQKKMLQPGTAFQQ